MAAPSSDPRATITPDSFTVAPALLGLPLARPWRRALAITIDGILVGILANAGGVVLAFAAAITLWVASRPANTTGLARRGVTGLMRFTAALFLFIAVLNVWGRISRWGDAPDAPDAPNIAVDEALDSLGISLGRFGIALPDSIQGLGAADSDDSDDDAVRDTTIVAATDTTGSDTAAARIRALEQQRDRLRAQNARLERELDEERERTGGIGGFLRGIADDLGVGFGWGALYFTAFLALWRGQTPGKRALGLRVIRLDGRPIGWWIAFERFGGYAASFSIGLLGFAQILWDRNRQGLHDKAVETVVIRDLVPSTREGGGWQPAGR